MMKWLFPFFLLTAVVFGQVQSLEDELLIHEFGHEHSGDYLSSDYHEALCRLGARLAKLSREGAP